jgi:flavin-dependent dehydrogenase
MFDIAIIGAGPAGATLARLIGNSHKVLLIDKKQLAISPEEEFSHAKCCGGLLAPDAQEMLAVLGLGLPQHVLVGPQLFVVRTIDLQNATERYYQRFYINIDRGKFDRWLLSLLPASVDVRPGSLCKSFEKSNGSFQLKLFQNGKEYIEHAKILIGADGAFSMVRRQAFPYHPFPQKYIAVQEWFETERGLPYFTTIFDREITDFYSWTIPKEKFLLVGAALLPQKKTSPKFELLKKKLCAYGFELGKCVNREGAFILRPVSTSQICVGGNGIALLGEAAGWISPSSAEGLSYSFRSALLLAQSLIKGQENFLKHYYHKTRQMRKNILLKNAKSPFMYNPWIRKMVMTSGILSVDVCKID